MEPLLCNIGNLEAEVKVKHLAPPCSHICGLAVLALPSLSFRCYRSQALMFLFLHPLNACKQVDLRCSFAMFQMALQADEELDEA